MGSDVDEVDWRAACPISSALDVLGDRCCLLIIRDLLIHEPRTCSAFLASPEHISTNLLASKLKMPSCLQLIARTHSEATARNNALHVTVGVAPLRPVPEGLARWAQPHLKDQHGSTARIS